MKRETKIIEVGVHKVEIKTYLTGKEANDIKRAMFAGISVNSEDMKGHNLTLDISVTRERELVAAGCVSLDGVEGDILNKIENLPVNEYRQVVTELEHIVNKGF